MSLLKGFMILFLGIPSTSSGLRLRGASRACGGTLQGSGGSFSSPNYPSSYPGGSDCTWNITVPEGYVVKLTFTDFELESNSDCSYDFVEVRDGLDPIRSRVTAKLCGTQYNKYIQSTGRNMFVRFKTDLSVSKKGFIAVYLAGIFEVLPEAEFCPGNWVTFGNSDYKACNDPTVLWIDAQRKCQDIGAHLAKIDSIAENNFVRSLGRSYAADHDAWVGVTRGADNQFYWFDGTLPSYTNWAPYEPNNAGSTEHCAIIYLKGTGHWNDIACDIRKVSRGWKTPIYVCERELCNFIPLLASNSSAAVSRISASSVRDDAHSATSGTINSTNIWCPDHNSSRDWLEVDLGAPYFICGVAAVGDITTNNHSSTTWYRVLTSIERFNGTEPSKTSKQEFQTSKSMSTITRRTFVNKRIARYIRFVPRRWTGWPCLKVELYGEKVAPLIMAIPVHNITVEHLASLELRCLAYGFPFPTYTWTKDGSQVISNSQQNAYNSALLVNPININTHNEGWYTCTATNLLGTVSSSAFVTVHATPKVIMAPRKVVAQKGKDVVLWCHVIAKPLPTVTWINPTNGGSPDSRLTVNTKFVPRTNRVNSTLTIRNVTLKDMGSYTCKFANTRGTLERGIDLTIDGCMEPLGLGDPRIIPDVAFTASSYQGSYEPKMARLNSGSAWTARYHNKFQWIQVDLGTETVITQIGTAGKYPWHRGVKRYQLQYSADGTKFATYGNGKLFIADSYNLVNSILSRPISTRYIRVIPKTYTRGVSLRLELYGCPPERVPPKIFGLASKETFKAGSTAVLTCQARGFPYVTFRWIKTDPRNRTAVYLVAFNRVLTLVNLNDTSAGLYTCTASNIAGNDSFTIALHIHSRPTVQMMARETVVQLGTEHSLSCHGAGNPAPTVTWYKNGKDISSTADRVTISTSGTKNNIQSLLKIINTGYQDHGVYACVLTNYSGSANSSIVVTVQGPPRFTATPSNTTATAGDDVMLVCAASAIPLPTIRWKFNKRLISNAKIVRNGSLILENVKNNELFEGVFTCEASNAIGVRSSSASLVVYSAATISTSLKRMMEYTRAQAAVFHCDADGDPDPTFEWSKNGVRMSSTERVVFRSGNRLLVINPLEQTDTGRYECTAKNVVGNATTSTILRVFGKPTINRNLTRQEVGARIGYPTNMECYASNPLPVTFSWTKGGARVITSDVVKVHDNILVITPRSSDDFGEYVCHVTNIAGYNNYSIHLKKLWTNNNTVALVEASKLSHDSLAINIPIIVVLVIVAIVLLLLNVYQAFIRRRRPPYATKNIISMDIMNKNEDLSLLIRKTDDVTET